MRFPSTVKHFTSIPLAYLFSTDRCLNEVSKSSNWVKMRRLIRLQ